MIIEGVLRTIKSLRNKLKGMGDCSVIVGYSSAYALQVHEAVEMKLLGQKRAGGNHGYYWDPIGKAGPKFLENPARDMASELKNIVRTAMKQKKSLAQSLLLAGYALQAESMERVPVDYGFLRASAFTRLEERQ